MKLLLVSCLVILGLNGGVFAGFNSNYIQKIIETAQQQENTVFDLESVKPVEKQIESRATLNCQIIQSGTPTSVHALRPQNIEVLGAVGDSLTAANGAKARSILGLLDECRGVSWAMGCESTLSSSVTFATILKYFNPGLVGCSTGTGNQNSSVAVYNLAHPGETSFHMPGQARMLVSRMRANVANLDNKWKLVNFFIGGNDLCDACRDPKQTPDNFLKNIRDALDYLQANLPRTLVNLVLTLDVSEIEKLTGTTCRNMQNSFCDCGLSGPYRPTLKQLVNAYQNDIRQLIKSGRYDVGDLFTVVFHDFMTEMTIPLTSSGAPDYSYFAPDCFHFSVKGHEAAATELWNSLISQHQDKSNKWTLGSPIKCPSITDPYIPTSRNHRTLKSLLVK